METLEAAATSVTDGANTHRQRVRALVDWARSSLKWTPVEGGPRTPAEIYRSGHGNCYQQTELVRSLLATVGVPTRAVREIHLVDLSEAPRRYGDHCWFEFEDVHGWSPADPTLGAVGWHEWQNLRLAQASEHRPSGMSAPIAVFALGLGGAFEDRSREYLVNGFIRRCGPALVWSSAWDEWRGQIERLAPICREALRGKVSLQEYEPEIERLARAFDTLHRDVSA